MARLSVTVALRFALADGLDDVDALLRARGRPTVAAVPGYVLPVGLATARLY